MGRRPRSRPADEHQILRGSLAAPAETAAAQALAEWVLTACSPLLHGSLTNKSLWSESDDYLRCVTAAAAAAAAAALAAIYYGLNMYGKWTARIER